MARPLPFLARHAGLLLIAGFGTLALYLLALGEHPWLQQITKVRL